MPAHISMWSYLWDFVDDGIDETLRDMKDNLGLTALSVATHYHTVEHLRPHTRGDAIYRADSRLYFTPDEKHWTHSPMRHQVSPIALAGNPLKTLTDRAADVGLDVVSWTLCNHSSWLGERYPDATEQNALGDRYPEALCPANPDVRAFLAALLSDLSHNYKLSLLELESFHYAGTMRHYHHHEKIAIRQGPLNKFLLGVCFCGHCKSRAIRRGVDADAVQATFAEAIRDTFKTGEARPGTIASFIDEYPITQGYVDMRVDAVTSLIGELIAASSTPLSPIVWSSPELGGTVARDIADLAGRITVCAYHADPIDTRKAIEDATALVGDVRKLRVGYHVFPPVAPDRATLLRNIEVSLDLGVESFSLYNYGIAARRHLEWVRDVADLIRKRLD